MSLLPQTLPTLWPADCGKALFGPDLRFGARYLPRDAPSVGR